MSAIGPRTMASGQHQPLNRQADRFAREGVELSLSTLADQVGACAAALKPVHELIRTHVLAAERLHGPLSLIAAQSTAGQWTIRRCRCWPRAARLPPGSGPMFVTTGPLPVVRPRPRSSTSRVTGKWSIPTATWRDGPAFSRVRRISRQSGGLSARRTPMAATTIFTAKGGSPRRSPAHSPSGSDRWRLDGSLLVPCPAQVLRAGRHRRAGPQEAPGP